jgi:hemolysin activation/secretion protein
MLRLSTTTPAAALALALGGASWAVAADATPQPGTTAMVESAASPIFDVEAYDVDGNSLLDQPTIEAAVYPLLGLQRSRSDIEAARQDLEDAYHARGYDSVVVELPPQTVADHIVRLHVVETTVGRLRVTGTRFYSIEDVKRQAASIAEGQTPNFHDAQTEIAELNRNPERQVTPLVRPGQIPGTVDIDLKVSEQAPLHASVELNNDHPADTTSLRLTANVRYDNLWQRGHTLSLSYAVAPQNRTESEVFAGSYLAQIPQSRWSLLLYGYHSNGNVATLGDVTVLGKGFAAGARGIAQLPAIGPVNQSLSVGLDFKHFDQLIAAKVASSSSAGGAKTSLTSSAVSYLPLNVVYSLQLDTAASSTHASLGLTAGVRNADSSDFVFTQDNRSNARGDFIHVNLDLEHSHDLPLGLQADVRLTGQIADQPLISGEQFSSGGLGSVRGYRQAAATGDNGVFGSVELRSLPIEVAPRRVIDDWRIYAFGDAAAAWLIQPLAGQQAAFSLYSAGVGTRFKLLAHVDGDVLAAVPLSKARGSDVGRAYTQFSLKAGF